MTVGPGSMTEAEAEAAVARVVETSRVVSRATSSLTIGKLWDLWLADRAEDGYRNDIYEANWVSLAPAFATRMPDNLTVADCRAYARARFDAGRSPWTVATELTRLRACLHWAVDRKLIASAPKVWVPSKGRGRSRVLSFDEARRLLEAASRGDPHILTFVVLAMQTGARHTAILDLTWDRVDWSTGMIDYEVDLKPDPMSKAWRKGRAEVPMGSVTRGVLENAFRGRQSPHVVEHGGRRLKTVRAGFAAAVERAGLDGKVTPHTLRHTVATWVAERDGDSGKAQALLGHADRRTTELVYTHVDASKVLGGTVEAIDEVMRKPAGEVATTITKPHKRKSLPAAGRHKSR